MADDDITQGLKTAVEAVEPIDDEDDGPEPPVHQVPLFPSDRLDELAEDAAGRRAQYREPRRGPGRPPGAKNKRTTDWIAFLERRYPSPLVTLAEMRSRSVHQLAEELGCKPLEAAALQVRCADIEAPYWHGKKPVDVNLNTTRPMLVMTDPNAWLSSFEARGDGGEILDMTAVRVRSTELFDAQNEALGQAVAGLDEHEQGGNSGGTSERMGAGVPHGADNILNNNEINHINTRRLRGDEVDDEPGGDR